MGLKSNWDWEVGQRTVVESLSPMQGHGWQEEPYVSDDGERLAAVVQVDEGEFSVRVNNEVHENTYEKIWHLRFAPDGRLTALCQQDMEWGLGVDGELVGETTDYVWETKFSADGSVIANMYKSDERYAVALNGVPWEEVYENVNQYTITADGAHSAGVAQVVSLGQADIEGFKKGVYTVAVDGKCWENKYLNIWTPTFNKDGSSVAAQVRTGVHNYTIAVDDKPWSSVYNQVWEPVFHPVDNSVACPVRVAGKWGVAKDGVILWEPRYLQCLELQYSAKGNKLWAIVATSYGQFTACVDNAAWGESFDVAYDLVVSPNGERAGILTNTDNANFKIVVDGTAWAGVFDMAWPVVFDDQSKNVACLVEKGARYKILVNGKEFERDFDRAWPPAFSDDGSKVLIRAIENNSYVRIVADVAQF
jgi:hypothetical protein